MTAADGIILGSPTYFADITPEFKALIDRSGRVGGANGGLYRRKVGSGVSAIRRGGAIHALDSIQHFQAKITLLVVDEQSTPIVGARAGVTFEELLVWGSKSIPVNGVTDKNGLFTASEKTSKGDRLYKNTI